MPDIEKYEAHLDGLDLTKDQKAELIEALWLFCTCIVDQVQGLDPVSLGGGAPFEKLAAANPDAVSLSFSVTDDFSRKAEAVLHDES
ncbi:hypothetical protein [Amorphus sp. 3PC139-8]|uniref:hypothetical protein n=1 Tax=Amorphus sp. 3PC139-8 TaxID=2735676 RepID=UPI00345D3FB7